MKVNFGRVAENYSRYRNDLPDTLIPSLKIRGVDFHDKTAADLGSGTGVLSRALFKEGAYVTGVEPSSELIVKAEEQDQKEGLQIDYRNEQAEATELEKNRFDYVTVLRAWHWFDRRKALKEIRRISKERSTLLIIDSGFVSKAEIIVETTNIISKYQDGGKLVPAGAKAKADQVINGFPVEWFLEWQDHHFDLTDTYKLSYNVTFTNKEWCGRIGSLSWMTVFNNEKQDEILHELYEHLLNKFGETTHKIEHACFVAILERKQIPVDFVY